MEASPTSVIGDLLCFYKLRLLRLLHILNLGSEGGKLNNCLTSFLHIFASDFLILEPSKNCLMLQQAAIAS